MNAAKCILLGGVVACCMACGEGRRSHSKADDREASTGHIIAVSDSILLAGLTDTVALGRLREGETTRSELTLRNVGAVPFVIIGAETSCGCTTPEYAKEPLKPGSDACFAFEFNSTGFSGVQLKTISVRTSLDPKPFRIIVTAEVE